MHSKRMHEFTSDIIVNSAQLAYIEDAHGTNMMLLMLNEFFRYYFRDNKTATLYKEIEILNKYVSIQKMRVGDKFSLDVENDVSYQSINVNKMAVIEVVDRQLTELIEQSSYVWINIEIQLGTISSAFIRLRTEKGSSEYRVPLDIEPFWKEDGNVQVPDR